MFEGLGIGDLHLTDSNGKGGLAKYIESHDQYVISEVQRVCDYAIKCSIEHVIFYGDICDGTRMSYQAMTEFTKLIRRNKDLMFWLILGNHDKDAKESSVGHSMQIIKLMRLANLRIIEEDTVFEINKVKVKFLPWPSSAFNKKMLNIGHTEVYGAATDTGRKMESDDLSKSRSVVCMGHLHTCHQVRETYYSGTLYQTNFGESLPKFFHHIKFKSVEDYEIINVPFDPVYKLFNCVVETQADVKALPRDVNHLIKLVVKDGADVIIPDLPNIVLNKAYTTKSDLEQILTEDLLTGNELVFKTSDFYRSWIDQQSICQSLKNQTSRLRKEILNASSK